DECRRSDGSCGGLRRTCFKLFQVARRSSRLPQAKKPSTFKALDATPRIRSNRLAPPSRLHFFSEPFGAGRRVGILAAATERGELFHPRQLGADPVLRGGELAPGERVLPALARGGGLQKPLPGDHHGREEIEVAGRVRHHSLAIAGQPALREL